ncbi:MAG: DUF3784 domain-containing protein [Flavobacteriaceae bacterium]
MSICIPVVIVTVTYFIISITINKNNAKYFLSPYNRMSEAERKNFDLDKFLIFFKNFFRQQSVYSFSIFVIFKWIYSDKIAISIYSLLITLSLIYLVIKSNKFYR